MKKQKQPSPLSRLMEYAGSYKILTYLSWVLSFISALTALLPFVYIFFIIREVLEVAPDFSRATSIVHNGIMAVVFSAAALVIYIGALMCSHVSTFRIGSNIKRRLLRHITNRNSSPSTLIFGLKTSDLNITTTKRFSATSALPQSKARSLR